MSPLRRKTIRRWAWTALIFSLIWDGWLGENAISPDGGFWFDIDRFGHLIEKPSSAGVWMPIACLVLLQGVLVLALIRLREPRDISPSIFRPPEGPALR
jgi:hypothetical protein